MVAPIGRQSARFVAIAAANATRKLEAREALTIGLGS